MWPDELFVEDTRTPMAILEEQARALAAKSGGRIIADLPHRTVDDLTQVDFEIVAPAIKRRHRLFSIRSGMDDPYPVEILPPQQRIAKGLQTEVVVESGVRGLGFPELGAKPPKLAPNPWFIGTEADFVAKLQEVLNHPATRGVITSLLALVSQKNDGQPNGNGDSGALSEADATDTTQS
jgi:hypothetical protein